MTLLIGCVTSKYVLLGADSALTSDDGSYDLVDDKITAIDRHCGFALAGDPGYFDRVRTLLLTNKDWRAPDPEYTLKTIIPAIKEISAAVDTHGEVLLVNRLCSQPLLLLDGECNVLRPRYGFVCAGSGAKWAQGAMFEAPATPQSIEHAVLVTSCYCTTVRAPARHHYFR